MKIVPLTLTFTLIMLIILIPTQTKMNFQKTIWVYWQTDITTAPLVTRASYEKMQIAAKQSNWTLVLVNGSNVKDYLKEYQRFQEVVQKGYRNTVQEKSDILRISLIEENGGVWIDFACILFDSLEWLSDQTLFDHLLINKIGNNRDDPDMLMMGEGYHQSPLSYYNKEGRLQVDEYFGNAIHFIAAKKKSPIMSAWKEKMYTISSLSYRQMVPHLTSKPFFFHFIDRPDSYYSGNLALQSVIQQKQISLDSNLTLGSSRQNAYEQYKIWMFHGEVGPIAMMRYHLLKAGDLFFQTRQEVERRTGRLWFYLKAARWLRDIIEDKQNVTRRYLEENDVGIDDILTTPTPPTLQQCSLYFIVNNSILHILYNNSRYEHEVSMLYITLQQRDQLIKRCLPVNPELYEFRRDSESWGEFAKAEREIFFYEGQKSFEEGLKVFWMANRFVIMETMWNFSLVLMWVTLYVVLRWIGRRWVKKVNSRREVDGKEDNNNDEDNFNHVENSTIMRQLAIILIRCAQLTASLSFYESIDAHGKYPQYQCTLLLMAFLPMCDLLITIMIYMSPIIHSSTLIAPKTFLSFTFFPLYMPLAYTIFIHLDISSGLAHYHAMIIGANGLLLYMLLKEIGEMKLLEGFSLLKRVCGLFRAVECWGLVVFVGFCGVESARYVMVGGHYVKEYISTVVGWVFYPSVIVTLILLVENLILKLASSSSHHRESPQTQEQQHQNPTSTSPHQTPPTSTISTHPTSNNHPSTFNKPNLPMTTTHFLLTTLLITSVACRTYALFSQALQAPSQFNYFGKFYQFVVVYVLCGLAVKMHQGLGSRNGGKSGGLVGYVAVYALVGALPVIYVVLGDSFFLFIVKERWFKASVVTYCVILMGIYEILVASQSLSQKPLQSEHQSEFPSPQSHNHVMGGQYLEVQTSSSFQS